MKGIRDCLNFGLIWQQPKALHRNYELHAGSDIIAQLTWLKTLGSLAKAESADGIWTFKRVGFLRSHVTARLEDSERDIAVFEPGWSGAGWLTLASGLRLRWKSVGFWRPVWSFSVTEGQPLISFKSAQGFFTAGAELDIAHAARDLAELPLLICLGWYIILLHDADQSSSVALITMG
jgi:hypothetical protein